MKVTTEKIIIEIDENDLVDQYKELVPKHLSKPTGQCSKCGIDLYPVMGYYCSNFNCPSGLGSNYSLTNEVTDQGKQLLTE